MALAQDIGMGTSHHRPNHKIGRRPGTLIQLLESADVMFYAAMLDPIMSYSCGYWKDAKDLEQTQFARLRLICNELELKSGERLLDMIDKYIFPSGYIPAGSR